ncbi:TonB-linked SusC/RagA family outer membrane protein [Dysgonomonas alginatilytica]|uniref:TonB-linked SusC/RagA family outer membrane protein n=1 Tax=Dysgonomonas alginatilytica TaxID=1605892 RepID=A0A2V3PRZ7_9BACT|nr:SusC/RagA family TonB-linked outer membrane protein [Dysgonomonas alginatilytica]PXV65424.1 TonB-linked SusC/RagA family outer membrane protein [Dysgonomonas alginatilytica]
MENSKHIRQTKVPKRRRLGLLSPITMVLIMLLSGMTVKAQTGEKITVSGIVTDGNGETLIGASVVQKGTTNASMTGLDGDYKLTVPSNATLVVTYVGFNPKEVQVGGRTKLDIVVSEDTKLLDEVVVTALGIKRDKKSLGYSLEEVKGDRLTETRDPNITNALTGKVAGLLITQSGTGPSGSSRIVLRGNNSLAGNNQPLIVVDGVPIDSSTGGTDDFYGNKNVDRGSAMADISPDDVESMSILKGPAAAALYGSRAGNGVIMITTKKGSFNKGLGVSINSNLTIDNPMQLPKLQNSYGQGSGNLYDYNKPASWGARMQGQDVVDMFGNKIKYTPSNNKITDFLRTGNTWTNSVDLSKGNENSTVRLGVLNMKNDNVVPNSDFRRTSATLRATANLSKKLSFDAKVSYINQETNNRIKLAGDPDNIFYNYLLMPRSVHFNDLANTYPNFAYPEGTLTTARVDLSGKPVSWTPEYSAKIRNPYWAANKNTNIDKRNRFIGFASLKYEFTDWLNIQGRYGIDYHNSKFANIHATGTPYWQQSGDYLMQDDTFYETNADFLITMNRSLTEKIGLVATAGGNIMYQRSDYLKAETGGLGIPNWYTLKNGLQKIAEDGYSKQQINSLYATASFSYDNTLYLDLTARNDWSSMLNPNNWSYFYPSVSASWLITESLNKWDAKPSFLDYAKLRASWADVGNSGTPYQLLEKRGYGVEQLQNGTPIIISSLENVLRFQDLKEERVRSYEVGFEAKAFNNRVGLDVAFYNKEARNQILKADVPSSTGYKYKIINAGNVRNRGIELLLSGVPVQTKDIQWNVDLNFAKNQSKILELDDEITQQILSDGSISDFLKIVAQVGGNYGDLYGKPYMKKDGQILVNSSGLPIADPNFVKMGNFNPDWMGGIVNNIRVKNVSFMFQIDMRYGGDVYMGSIREGMSAGTLEETLANREEGFIVNGVFADGTPNNKPVLAEQYWSALAGISEPWIYDATNVRLREASIGYTFPKSILRKTPLQSAKLSLVGRNLWMIYSKTKGFDPEAGYSTGNAQGLEFGSMPTLRSLGFNVNISF